MIMGSQIQILKILDCVMDHQNVMKILLKTKIPQIYVLNQLVLVVKLTKLLVEFKVWKLNVLS